MVERTPIDDRLWGLTLPAVRAAWAAAQEYVESGKFVPRLEDVTYAENNSGWPSTVSDSRQFSRTGPINWSGMFSLQSSDTSYVVVSEVADLSRAVDAVVERANRDAQFASRMSVLYGTMTPEWRERALRVGYLELVGSIIGRAVATGTHSDDDLLDIYLPLERARFALELSGDLVVPVTLTDFGTDEPVILDDEVRIERLSPDFQCARALSLRGVESINPYLVAAATHAIVVQQVTIPNHPYATRTLGSWGGTSPISSDDMDKVARAIQCVHIITGANTGYNQVLIRPHGWTDKWESGLPPVWKVDTTPSFPERLFPAPWNETRQPLDPKRVAEISAAYLSLARAPKDVQLAARRAVRAMMRTNDEDRTLDSTIGIEALLLDDNAELKYRMAFRAAAALFDEYDPRAIFELANKVYAHRSAIAHGKVNPKTSFEYGGRVWNSSEIGPVLLRALLRSRLLSAHPWVKKDLEPRILAALALYKPDEEGEADDDVSESLSTTASTPD